MRRPLPPDTSFLLLALVLIALPGCLASPARADLMIVGNDQKVVFDAEGNRSFVAPGKDTVVGRGPRQPRGPAHRGQPSR